MSEIEFKYTYKQGDYQFPLFKFMTEQNGRALLDDGELYLPPLSSFAKPAQNGSLINDSEEGVFETRRPDGTTQKTKLHDAWVYCVASQLIGQSTQWAIKEGKTTCVMITDPKAFLSCIKQYLFDSKVSEFFPCKYTDEPRIAAPETDLRQFFWYKPEAYRLQREVRFVAAPNELNIHSLKQLEGRLLRIPELRQYLIEIDVSAVEPNLISDLDTGKVLHRVHKTNGQISEFEISVPTGVYSMTIVGGKLGFITFENTNLFAGAKISNCHTAMMGGPRFLVFALNNLVDVTKVELISRT